MVLGRNECANALYNANYRDLLVSALMGFFSYYKNLIQVGYRDFNPHKVTNINAK